MARVLVVASPLVSRGGLYAWLSTNLPLMEEAGHDVALLWSIRVEAQRPADVAWERRLDPRLGGLGGVAALARDTRRSIDSFGAEVLLSVTPQADIACALASRRCDVPWIAMSHGKPWPAKGEAGLLKRMVWRSAVRRSLRVCHRHIVVSDALRRECLESGIQTAPEVVHNGVPIASEYEKQSRDIAGFLGRLSIEKDPELFVAVVGMAGCKGVVFGDGPLRQGLESTIAGSDQEISVAGWTDRDTALSDIDVLVITSRREALGLSLLEAGARGVCVLAKGVGGIPEILKMDPKLAEHCLMPGEASAHEIAQALSILLDRDDLRFDLGRRLRDVVQKHFDINLQARLLSDIVGKVAHGAKRT